MTQDTGIYPHFPGQAEIYDLPVMSTTNSLLLLFFFKSKRQILKRKFSAAAGNLQVDF